MRNIWILTGIATTLSLAALVIAIVTLLVALGRETAPTGLPQPGKDDPSAYTVSLVNQALARYEVEGQEATVNYYNTPASVDGEWYVFIVDAEGKVIAHSNQSLLGEDLRGGLGIDATGYRFGEAILDTSEQGQWVDYLFLNPGSGNQEYKHSWVVQRDGLIFGSGWYQVLPPAVASPGKDDLPAYTVSLVEQAIDYYQANGRQAAIDYYNDPDNVDGRWYVFMYDENNIRIAHPTVKSLLGKPVAGPTGVDINGYAYGQDMVKTTEAGQWVSYVFLNPSTGREEVKHTWLKKHYGLMFGSGWYEGNHQVPPKSNPIDHTVSLVQQALRRYARQGQDATIDYYNTPESVDGEWYVFIIGADGRIMAHANQSLVGQDLKGDLGVDVTGYRFGDSILAATEEGLWVDYVFENLTTGNQEYKHSWVVQRDGLIFGSGWYQVLPNLGN